MLSGMLWDGRKPEETWVEHLVSNRRQARGRNEAVGHNLWGRLALNKQLTFAVHVARLPEGRMVKVVSGAHGIETWRTTGSH